MKISLIIGIIILVSILVTFLLNQLFKQKRYIKYIPVVGMVPFMIYNFVTMYSAPSENFEALGRMVMGIFLLTAIISSLISAFAFDVIYKRKNATN